MRDRRLYGIAPQDDGDDAQVRQNAYLDVLFELAPDAAVLTTLRDARIVRVNREFTRTFGYPSDEAVGRCLRDLIMPDRLEPILPEDPELLAGGKVEWVVVRRRKDGTRFHAHLTGKRIRLGDGEDAAYLIFRDIGPRIEAEAMLAAEKRLLEVIAGGGPLAATLEALCRLAEEVDPGVRVSILLVDANGRRLRHGAGPSLPPKYCEAIDGAPVGLGIGPCAAAAHLGERVISIDFPADERWSDEIRTLASTYDFRACWSTPIRSSQGRVLGTFALYPDESARPTAEQASRIVQLTHLASIAIERARSMDTLRQSEERYALAMEAAADGHMDWNLVTGEHHISPRMLKMVGHAPDVAFDDYADWERRLPLHAEDRPRWEAATAAHFGGQDARFRGDFRIVVNGETRWLAFNFIATRDAAGNVARWTGSIADIHDAKRDVAAVLDAIPGLVAILTPAGEVDAVNHELIAYCGQPLEAMRQWGTNGTVHADDLPRVATIFMHAIAAGMRYDFDARIRRFDGEYRWHQVRGLPLRGSIGQIVRWYVLLADVDAIRRAEEALRLSEERYALAVAGSDDGVWDVDFIAGSVFVSKRARELAGMPAGADVAPLDEWFAGLPIHPEDVERRIAAMQAHLVGDAAAYECELRLRQSDGTYRWRRLHGLCLRNHEGKPRRMAGSISDVDARRRAEDALRLSEERYALALEASEEGHFDNDLVGGDIFVSARVNEIYGFTRQAETVNRIEFLERMPLHPDDRARVIAELKRSDWEDPEYDVHEIECRIVPRPGETRWIHSRAKVVRDARGRARRRVGVVSDITERKRAEEALREQTERLQLGQAAMRMIIMDWNVAEDVLTWSDSPEWLRGPVPEDGRYPPFKDQVHPDDRDGFLATRRRALETLEVQTTEFRLVRTDGRVIWVLERKQAFVGPDAKAARMLAAMFDITDRKRAEEALSLSEERYALAMRASGEGHWDWKIPTGEIYVSPRYLELLSLPPDTTFSERSDFLRLLPFHPDDRAAYEAAVAAHFAGRTPRLDLVIRLLPKGELRWLHAIGECSRDADGNPVRWAGSVTDITDRKRAEIELRESEARFRALTALWSDWYWRQDEHLRFTFSTAAVDPPAGYPGGSAIGKARWELPGIVPLSTTWDEHRALLAARKPFRDFEYSRLANDGSTRYVSTSGTPMFGEDGTFRGYQGVARNITERKRVEEELRSRQEMLDVAQKAARAVAFEWRIGAGEGQNRWPPDLEAMHGIPVGTYDGTYEAWKALVHPEDWPRLITAIDAAERTGDVDAQYRVLRVGGAVRWLQAKGRLFFDPEGKPARIVGFVLDVTDRHLAEEELRRVERQLRQAQRLEALGTLAGGIAHDFNNLLGAILGYGEMALGNARSGTRLRRDVENILIAGERARALVDRILAFSRSGVGEQVAVHVEAIARETLALFAAKLPKQIVIEQRLTARRAAVMGDPTQIHQVLMNLLTNAAQAMPAGGTLRVSVERSHLPAAAIVTTGSLTAGTYVVMEIADSGSGIPPEILDRIFDPFFSTKDVGVGTGLGLSLVHGIAAGLGGAVDVATAVGRGSVFKVYLPLARDVAAPGKSLKRAASAAPRLGRGRVMVVDDEQALVKLATRTLTESGFSPTGFTSSAKAAEAFVADPTRFDAVVTDESMPGASGCELIRRMRAVKPTIPIVLVSGYLGASLIERAREAGATEVLKKPVAARQLVDALERVLRPAAPRARST